MTNLTAENISKHYGEKTLFENISFSIQDTDKIGLIGVNGTGKSTLLRILAGLEFSETGQLMTAKGLRFGYLSQNPTYDPNATVLDHVLPVIKRSMMKDEEIWDMESQARTILMKLGVPETNAIMDTLSGGQRKRVALAAALVIPCDLLILDEPTNHMDNNTIDWLEKHLRSRRGALLMVTHDRYFLDRVVDRTFEISDGKLYTYSGNYTEFLQKKTEREALASSMEQKRMNLYRKELDWIRRGAKARTTKQKARIQRFEELEQTDYSITQQEIQHVTGSRRLGGKIIELNKISKSYADKVLFKDFSYIFLKDDRVGIIGDNGIGKSTLLRTILNQITPDGGSVDIGQTVHMGYFSQESVEMDERLRALEYIQSIAETVTTVDGVKISASQLMENFLFTGEMQWTPISKLSGGEKRRLFLVAILIQKPNVLILDEPTNDLDIDTLKALEDYIDSFPGTVIAVSHDRYFLDRVCNKILAFEGFGKVQLYTGNYSDYLLHRPVIEPVVAEKPKAQLRSTVSNEESKAPKKKLTYSERLELTKMEETLKLLEEELSQVETKIQENSTDFVMLQELTTRKDQLEDQLLALLERQEYLSGFDL